MARRNPDAPLAVEVPAAGADHPSWRKVGIITAFGFIVGVAWPRLAGVRLGPSVPEAPSSAASGSVSGAALEPSAGGASASGLPAAAAVAPASSPSASPAPPSVEVSGGVVYACKNADGDSHKGPDCGDLPGLDGVVTPRLRKMARCPEAAGASGKLHLAVRLDFNRDSLAVELGRGQTVGTPEALLGCARSALADAKLGGISHANPRYSVAYTITFEGAPSAASAPVNAAPAKQEPSGGEEAAAQVTWEVAIVRDAPRTGKVVAKLQRGTALRVGAAKDGWYPVKYGDAFANDGWVYRGAIGR
jgi:hypothetical protein